MQVKGHVIFCRCEGEIYGLPLAMTGRMTIGSTLYFCAPGETGELGDNLARGDQPPSYNLLAYYIGSDERTTLDSWRLC